MASTPEEQLHALGITLPEPAAPVANYVPYVRTGNLVFIAGQISRTPDGANMPGKLGDTMTVEQGYAAARSAAIFATAAIKSAVGDLSKVSRIVRMFSMVNCTPDFGDQPNVADGASDLFVDVFGDKGRHARCAIGHASLPGGAAIELEIIVEVAG
jgi:enamine deaminase RidA (YjgF/YER057c/UK114 family)